MTIEKIKVQHPTSYNIALIEEKLNTIIDWINEHDNSGRHIVPSNSLTGGEKYCGYCDSNTGHNLDCPEPKSNTLREKTMDLLSDYANFNDGGVKLTNEILSLVKEHLEKEINQSLKETKYDDNDREWAAKLQYNKAIYDIKQIIKNL